MNARTNQLETSLRQLHADQGGEATFAEFVEAVSDDPSEQGHADAREYTGRLVIQGIIAIVKNPGSLIQTGMKFH